MFGNPASEPWPEKRGRPQITDHPEGGLRGQIDMIAGSRQGSGGDGGPATQAQLNWPYGVALDGLDNLFIADAYNHRIREVFTP